MNVYICRIRDFEDFAGLSLLSRERQDQLFHYLRKEDQLRCLCGGLLMRFLLGDRAKDVAVTRYGKPCLPNENLCFNLSHAGAYVVIAADRQEIGVDIEDIRAVPVGVAEKCFTADERTGLKAQSSERAFFMLWTAKESVIKASGKGFHMLPESFSVMPMENGWHRADDIEWYLQWHEVDGHVICVASRTDEKAEPCLLNRERLLKARE